MEWRKRIRGAAPLALGVAILWSAQESGNRIQETYDLACEIQPQCDSIHDDLWFLRFLSIVAGVAVPISILAMIKLSERH